MKNKIFYNLIPVFSVAAAFILWFIAARIANSPLVLPSPKEVFKEFFSSLGSKNLYVALGFTVIRTAECFLISLIFGAFFGYLKYKYPAFERAVYPFSAFLRTVPTMSVILILLVFVNSSAVPVCVAFLIVLPLVSATVKSALSSLDGKIFEMAEVYGVKKSKIITAYALPATFGNSYSSLLSELSLSFKVVISAEVISDAINSMGRIMAQSKYDLETGKLFAYTLICVAASVIFETAVKLIARAVSKKGGRK